MLLLEYVTENTYYYETLLPAIKSITIKPTTKGIITTVIDITDAITKGIGSTTNIQIYYNIKITTILIKIRKQI